MPRLCPIASNEVGSNTQRILATTMGAAPDYSRHDLRRLFSNAAFWMLGWKMKFLKLTSMPK
jgi:hypothetical protein